MNPLTIPQRQQLLRLLADCITSHAETSRLARYNLNLNLEQIASRDATLLQTQDKLLSWAERNDQLSALVAGLLEFNKRSDLRLFAQELAAAGVIAPPPAPPPPPAPIRRPPIIRPPSPPPPPPPPIPQAVGTSGMERRALQNLLVGLGRSGLEQTVSLLEDGLLLPHIAGEGGLQDQAFNVLVWVESRGKLDRLLHAMHVVASENPRIWDMRERLIMRGVIPRTVSPFVPL